MIRMNSQKSDVKGTDDLESQNTQDQEYQPIDLSFLGSLVPGIVHNLATPMSGVLGATQLIENRNATLADIINSLQLMEEQQRAELLNQFDRSRASVDILARNARHLAEILQVLVQRLNRGASQSREFYSLNDLIQNEVRFLEANLTFKHKVKKQLVLAPDLPASRFVYSHVAGTTDDFVTRALALHNFENGILEMDFVTESRDGAPTVMFAARYSPFSETEDFPGISSPYIERLEHTGWQIETKSERGVFSIRLICPRLPA